MSIHKVRIDLGGTLLSAMDLLRGKRHPFRNYKDDCRSTAHMLEHIGKMITVVKAKPESLISFADALCILDGTAADRVAGEILAERRRQIAVEGWTLSDDDNHPPGALAAAGACYAVFAAETQLDDEPQPCGCPPPAWPWAREWWKPNGVRRALVKAGALIIAEIEKIDRKAARGEFGVEVAR